jgi:hypothetical protein
MQQGPPPGGGYQYPPQQPQQPQQPYPQQPYPPYQQPYQQQVQPVYDPLATPPKDPTTGLLLELIGLFGFAGIGWLWAGETAIGVALLLGFWAFLAVEVFLMFIVIGFCLLPFNLIIPIVSGVMLQNRLKARQAQLAAQQYPAQQYPSQQFPF